VSSELDRNGVLIRQKVLPREATRRLCPYFDQAASERAGARSFAVPNGINDLIAPRGQLGVLAAEEASEEVVPVRVLLFDKTPAANWAVPWHQDRTIAVKARHEVAGFEPWSVKDGVAHVEPPISLLEGMLTLRLFVDDCGHEDGPLEVAIGSHRLGRLPGKETADIVGRSKIFVGSGRAGDVLVMKTLAVHCSKRARSPGHRRVLHVDYAADKLPSPLEWMLAPGLVIPGF
jgi:Phytanoyl-CoA dioxygenase (PhyH)